MRWNNVPADGVVRSAGMIPLRQHSTVCRAEKRPWRIAPQTKTLIYLMDEVICVMVVLISFCRYCLIARYPCNSMNSLCAVKRTFLRCFPTVGPHCASASTVKASSSESADATFFQRLEYAVFVASSRFSGKGSLNSSASSHIGRNGRRGFRGQQDEEAKDKDAKYTALRPLSMR